MLSVVSLVYATVSTAGPEPTSLRAPTNLLQRSASNATYQLEGLPVSRRVPIPSLSLVLVAFGRFLSLWLSLDGGRIKEPFEQNGRFICCDQFPAPQAGSLSRLSEVIGSTLKTPVTCPIWRRSRANSATFSPSSPHPQTVRDWLQRDLR